jgi:hypothetical protein
MTSVVCSSSWALLPTDNYNLNTVLRMARGKVWHGSCIRASSVGHADSYHDTKTMARR